MRKLIMAILLAPFVCFANPSPFGMEVGKMKLAEFKEKYESISDGINTWTGGRQFEVPTKQLDFEGLREVSVVFNKDEKLVFIICNFRKSEFEPLFKMLSEKYQIVDKDIPFVGNKLAAFLEEDVGIELDCPHLGRDLTLKYYTKDFKIMMKKAIQEHEALKEKNHKSKL